jgi:sulfatase maturation enzyme AslB (radical SAM superfamily)
MNNSLCSYPWIAAAIRPNGLVIPCCRYPHIDEKESHVDNLKVRNTPHWVNLRDSMLNGEKIDGCHGCYQDEANGLKSMRHDSLTKYVPISNTITPIKQLEVSFSNLCNLACAHCSSFFSTKWYSEDVKAGRKSKSGILENNFNFDLWDLTELNELKIIGGEPFMEQDQFISLLKKIDLSKITLQICTNGTMLPKDELKELIEQCKNVYLQVSLDGLGTTNDWYRWPSKFDNVTGVMLQYQQWWKEHNNVHLSVHHVVNVINVLELKEFVDYMQNVFSLWKVEWDWIRWPAWQQLSILPDDIKTELCNKFEQEAKVFHSTKIPNPYNVTIQRINESNDLPFDIVEKNVSDMSVERNLDYKSMLPLYKKRN